MRTLGALRKTWLTSAAVGVCAFVSSISQAATAQDRSKVDTPQVIAVHGTPANSANCGYRGAPFLWSYGGVFVDTSSLHTRSKESVAVIWCAYLASGAIPDAYSTLGRWSDAQLADDLKLDLGIEWARATSATARDSRIRFRVDQIDTGSVEHFVVKTVIEHVDSTTWTTRAVHTIFASVEKDTVRFESTLVPKLKTAMRWISSPIEFVRIDTGAVDTLRARAATEFVADIRRRAGLTAPLGEHVLYLYTNASNGRDALGFSEFAGAIDGFSSQKPTQFVFANVPLAGEFYRHELVHVAFMASPITISNALNESLAKALGGTLHRTWPEFVCEERSLVLKPANVSSMPAFFAKPDSTMDYDWLREWEMAFFIDFMVTESGDESLRKLISGSYDLRTRAASRQSIANIMGLSVPTFIDRISARYEEKALAQRCKH